MVFSPWHRSESKFPVFIRARSYWITGLHCCYAVLTLSHSVCPTLCNPMDCSPRGPSVHGIFQVRLLSQLPFSLQSIFRIQGLNPCLCVSYIGGQILCHCATWEARIPIWAYLNFLLRKWSYFQIRSEVLGLETSAYAFGLRGHSSVPNIHQADFLYVKLHSTRAAGWGCF